MEEDYKIRFSSLKDGIHNFSFKIGNEFFEHIDYSELKKAELQVEVQMDKQSSMMILDFEIKGKVEVMCDKCTDNLYIDTETESQLIYKFTDNEFEDEKVIAVYPNEIEIDITHPIYEFTVLSIPTRIIHPDGLCNQDMLNAMREYLLVDSDNQEETESDDIEKDNIKNEIDPRWSELNKLKNKNK
jgi:uncharacterized metal-binding protein YceD (DUF177 family)